MKGIVNETTINEKVVGIVSEYTGIGTDKVNFFIENAGLKAILENPSIICTDQTQMEKVTELRTILEKAVKADESV